MMKLYLGLFTSLVGGGGIVLALNGNPWFALLALPVVLFFGWLISGLYFMDHWEWERFKASMWNR